MPSAMNKILSSYPSKAQAIGRVSLKCLYRSALEIGIGSSQAIAFTTAVSPFPMTSFCFNIVY